METMVKRLGNLSRIGVAMLLIALGGNAGVAGVEQRVSHDREITALAYDAATDVLFKADARTVYRSGNGGRDWESVAVPPASEGRIAVIAAPANSKDVLYIAGPGLGLLRTDDGGKTWARRDEGLPNREVTAFAVHTTQPDTLYAFVPTQGIHRSQDAGKTWRKMDRGPEEGINQLTHSNMAGSMQSGWLFAATPRGVRRVMDCFCLWSNAGELASEAYNITFDPTHPEQIYVASQKGLFRSTNGGEEWTPVNSPGASVTALAFAPSEILFAVSSDGALFRSTDQGNRWEQVGE